VLLPDLMRFSKANFLAERYANDRPPRCWCPLCGGGFLDSFNSQRGNVRAQAHAHNAATWNSWLPDLFAHSNLAGRQQWWKTRCQQAVDAHERENVRIRQPKAFNPPRPLQAWATLPLSHPSRVPPADAGEQHPLV
jgi:hypothetical protein